MGEAKRRRDKQRRDREAGLPVPVREFAREPRQRPTPDDARSGRLSSYARWEIGTDVYGWMILLAYLEYAEDGNALPATLFAPRRPDESEEDFATRRRADQLLVETSAMAGTPRAQVAEVLSSWVPQSMVQGLVHRLGEWGAKLLDDSGATVAPAAWAAGARPLLGGLCPATHWDAGLDQLEVLASSRLVVTEPARQQLVEYPVAAVHAMAALVAWLYDQTEVVPDRAKAVLELAETAGKMGKFVF
ncbi:hypothetical protein ACMATS_25010 [Streptoverticillium reticulum]|uniref:hypothetical protein n=1 Tax=Streptoverticillium reticulum TaxID=1433415 RepID=UPI0039BFB2E0